MVEYMWESDGINHIDISLVGKSEKDIKLFTLPTAEISMNKKKKTPRSVEQKTKAKRIGEGKKYQCIL